MALPTAARHLSFSVAAAVVFATNNDVSGMQTMKFMHNVCVCGLAECVCFGVCMGLLYMCIYSRSPQHSTESAEALAQCHED